MLTNHARERKSYASERGFTLPELMIVIVLLGILAAIAIPSWFGLVEARRVESAANQLASDLRLAHSRASNQIGMEWKVTFNPSTDSSTDYILEPVTPDPSVPPERKTFSGDVEVSDPSSEAILTFKSDGAATSSGAMTVSVSGGSGSPRNITVSPTTSNVEVSP